MLVDTNFVSLEVVERSLRGGRQWAFFSSGVAAYLANTSTFLTKDCDEQKFHDEGNLV